MHLYKRVCIGILCLLAMLLGATAQAEVFFARPPADWKQKDLLEWTIFDTDEGDAMLLSCGGESMMVDGGPSPFRKELRDALDARDLRHMKYYLCTHNHNDHIDGLNFLFYYGFTADEFLHPYSDIGIKSNSRMERTVKAAANKGVPSRRVFDGDRLVLGGADIEIHRCTLYSNNNAKSLVLKVTFGDSSILLCADIIGKTQRYFYENLPAETLNADLIKLPHHAITPVVPEFLEAVSPKAAIATNKQKEIDNKSLKQLAEYSLPTLFSGDGTVYAVTDGQDWYLYQTVGQF